MTDDLANAEAEAKQSRFSKFFSTAVALALLAGSIVMAVKQIQSAAGLDIGQVAPAFSFERPAGGTVSLEQHSGKVVLLDFWATWCPPCRDELPYLVKLAKEYEPKGVVFIAASEDDADTRLQALATFTSRELPELSPYIALSNSRAASAYRVQGLPTVYVIGKDGKVLNGATGQVSESTVRRWLDTALGN